jgi:hypothetical protein
LEFFANGKTQIAAYQNFQFMKHFNAVLFLLFVSQSVMSQSPSWDLFPLHQKSWWRTKNDLKVYYCDSVEAFGNTHLYYFGLKYIQEPFGKCFFDLQTGSNEFAEKIPYDFNQFVSVEKSQWTWQNSPKPQFYANSAIGDQWRFRTTKKDNGFDEIEIAHMGSDSVTVLGVKTAARQFRVSAYKDSVLVIKPFSNAALVLTERFGFVQYLPLDQLYNGLVPEIHSLTGCQQGLDAFGLVPAYDAFMSNYKVGNVYKWLESSVSFAFNTDTKHQHLDSLIAVKVTPKDITLTAYRKTLTIKQKKGAGGVIVSTDSSYSVDPSHIRVLIREQLEPCINGVPGWLHEADIRYIQGKTLMYSTGKFDNNGGLTLLAETQLGTFSPKDCNILFLTDVHVSLGVHSECGYSAYRLEYLSGYEDEYLLGCRNGSKVWGDITPPTKVALRDPLVVHRLAIYPSLTKGPITGVDLPQMPDFEENMRLDIHDATGRLVYSDPAFTLGQWPDLSAQPAGLYVLSIQGKNALALGKVLKQ